MKINRIKNLFIFITLIILLGGCSEKSATQYSNKDPQYAQLAKYTQIVKVVINNEVRAIANITYLNGAGEKKWNDGYQHFLIGTYMIDDKANHTELKRVLDKKLIADIDETAVKKTDPIYKNIPLRNSWAKYKIVKFKDIQDAKKIVLRFSLDKKNFQDSIFKKSYL